MKRLSWFLLFAMGLLIFSRCGNEPPEPYFEGTPEDDSAIVKLLGENSHLLITSTPYDSGTVKYIFCNFPSVTFPPPDSFFRADSPLVKQEIGAIGNLNTKLVRFRDLWYAKDTTCTVYLWDTFSIISCYHWTKRYTGHYDSAWIDPLDTIPPIDTLALVLHTIDTNSTGGYNSLDTLTIEGCRHIFLEPKRDTATGEIIEPREWVLKRLTYGTYYLPNRGADYAPILSVYIKSKAREDTIQLYSYDTLYTGHTMNRLRSPDSLLEYSPGDTVEITVNVYPFASDTAIFCIAGCDTVRTFIPIQTSSQAGIICKGNLGIKGESGKTVNMYFGVFTRAAYYYVKPEKGLTGTIWLVPVKIK